MDTAAEPATSDPQEPCEPTPPVPVSRRQQSWWLWVMCLVGVDYFSSLAYQPSITYEVAGKLGPFATVLIVLITLFGLVPIYSYVAGQSPYGQGSFTLLERNIHGWRGKTIILILLGFATTDFVMTKTLSLADAAEHTIHNDNEVWTGALHTMEVWTKGLVSQYFDDKVVSYFNKQMMVTIVLGILGFVFWYIIRKGFNKRVVGVAVVVVGVYLLLTAVVIGSGLVYLYHHRELLEQWHEKIGETWRPDMSWTDWIGVAALFLVFLPQLSLGLSGFEMSMVVMPQIKGRPGESPRNPVGRIRNTRKLLITAALIMSVFLLGAVLVTTTLIPAEGFKNADGTPSYRALAYLARGRPLINQEGGAALNPLFGNLFGTLYDISTVVILCLAGTSVITSLQSLMPQFLLRFGMEQKWAQTWGILFGTFALINLIVTVWFRASVDAQRGAYATGVLVSIASAGVLTVIDRWRKRRGPWPVRFPWGYGLITLVIVAMMVSIIIHNPVGLGISVCFVVAIFVWSVISRAVRNDELRTAGFEFVNDESRFLWESMKVADFPALIPHRPGKRERDRKEQSIRQEHQLSPDMDIVFIEVDVEDPSDFMQTVRMEIFREDKRFVIRVTHCVSVAHAIAAVALELSKVGKPPCIHFGWSEISLLEASWSFFAFGEGNVPWKVREMIHNEQPDPERRPRVVIG